MALAAVVSLAVTASVEELCFFSESVPAVGKIRNFEISSMQQDP